MIVGYDKVWLSLENKHAIDPRVKILVRSKRVQREFWSVGLLPINIENFDQFEVVTNKAPGYNMWA